MRIVLALRDPTVVNSGRATLGWELRRANEANPISELRSTIIPLVDELRSLDPHYRVFGSEPKRFWRRGYRFNRKLSDTAVELFQRRHGILLPDDYREFITEIGDGGAGPYYGVKPLANAAKYTDLSTPFPWGSEMSPRSHSDRKLWEILPGVLVVAELGCGGTNVLVVNGCEEGWVWEDLTIEDLPLSPLHQSFSEWYIGWAERCIATIKREPLIDQVRIGMTVDEVRGILGDDIQQWGGFQSPDLPAYYISFTTTNASFSIDWDGRVMKINKWDFI